MAGTADAGGFNFSEFDQTAAHPLSQREEPNPDGLTPMTDQIVMEMKSKNRKSKNQLVAKTNRSTHVSYHPDVAPKQED